MRMRISAVAFVFLAYYGPCGAAIAGGLYTLYCCDSAAGDDGDGGGTDAGAAAGGAGGLDDPSIGVGAVDARIGAVLLGEDICQALCGLRYVFNACRREKSEVGVPRPDRAPPYSVFVPHWCSRTC